MSADAVRFGSLDELQAHVGDCHRCPLAKTRTRLVFGVGRGDAEVMFIGEAPGRNEDLNGEPFVGAAGQLLDELLSSAGLCRADVYIANILKCRPPNNRDPESHEIATCTPFLEEQIRLIDPVAIVTLGKFATQFVLDTSVGITQIRGRRHEVAGRAVLPIFHPAAALYDQTKRSVLFDDFQRLKALLASERERRAEDAPALSSVDLRSTPEAVEPSQETLF